MKGIMKNGSKDYQKWTVEKKIVERGRIELMINFPPSKKKVEKGGCDKIRL